MLPRTKSMIVKPRIPARPLRRHRQRRVALLVDLSRAYGRLLLLGVAKFVREHHEWSIQSEEWRWTEAVRNWLSDWKGDGVIAWVETPELAGLIRRLCRQWTCEEQSLIPDCRWWTPKTRWWQSWPLSI